MKYKTLAEETTSKRTRKHGKFARNLKGHYLAKCLTWGGTHKQKHLDFSESQQAKNVSFVCKCKIS